MAKDVTGQPWIFDATTQAEGVDNGGVFDIPIFVDHVVCKSNGTAGAFTVLEASGGAQIFDVDTTETDGEKVVPIGKYIKGFYVSALPSSGKIYVYHGEV